MRIACTEDGEEVGDEGKSAVCTGEATEASHFGLLGAASTMEGSRVLLASPVPTSIRM